MSTYPCPQGRREALALASMHVRAVVASGELRFMAALAASDSFGRGGSTVPARLRPRDEAGRFVRYAWLTDALNFEYGVIDMDFDDQPGVYEIPARVVDEEELWLEWADEPYPDWLENADADDEMT